MKTVEVYFDIKDYEKIDVIPGLLHTYEYKEDPNLKISEGEWGKIVFEHITIKFLGKNGKK